MVVADIDDFDLWNLALGIKNIVVFHVWYQRSAFLFVVLPSLVVGRKIKVIKLKLESICMCDRLIIVHVVKDTSKIYFPASIINFCQLFYLFLYLMFAIFLLILIFLL